MLSVTFTGGELKKKNPPEGLFGTDRLLMTTKLRFNEYRHTLSVIEPRYYGIFPSGMWTTGMFSGACRQAQEGGQSASCKLLTEFLRCPCLSEAEQHKFKRCLSTRLPQKVLPKGVLGTRQGLLFLGWVFSSEGGYISSIQENARKVLNFAYRISSSSRSSHLE